MEILKDKILRLVIQPLSEYYGVPSWEDKGREKSYITKTWVEALKDYSEGTLNKAVQSLIENREQGYFPPLSQVLTAAKQYEYINKSDFKMPEHIEDWWDLKFGSKSDEDGFSMNSKYKALNRCLEILNDSNEEIHGSRLIAMFNYKIIQNNFDDLARAYDKELMGKSNYKKVREVLKRAYKYSKGGKNVRSMLTQEVFNKNNIDEEAEII